MKMMVVSRTKSPFEILSIGIYSAHRRSWSPDDHLSSLSSNHLWEQSWGQSEFGTRLDSRCPTFLLKSSSRRLLPRLHSNSSILNHFLMTSHCVLQQRLNHKNTKEAFSGCEELKKFERRFVWHPGCHSPTVWNENKTQKWNFFILLQKSACRFLTNCVLLKKIKLISW